MRKAWIYSEAKPLLVGRVRWPHSAEPGFLLLQQSLAGKSNSLGVVSGKSCPLPRPLQPQGERLITQLGGGSLEMSSSACRLMD